MKLSDLMALVGNEGDPEIIIDYNEDGHVQTCEVECAARVDNLLILVPGRWISG